MLWIRRSHGQGVSASGWLVRWCKRTVAAAMLLGAMVAVFRMLASAPEEKLAAYEAAHMVPDENNAAIIYMELFRGEEMPLPAAAINLAPLMSAVEDPVSFRTSQALLRELRELEPSEQGLDPNVVRVATSRPWQSSEYPELRRWLETHRHRIDRMLEGSRKPSCRFRL